MFEKNRLDTGFPGKSYLPNLAKADDGTIFCAFCVALDSIWITQSRDAGKTWAEPVKVMDMPREGYIADPNVLVVGSRVTVFATFLPAPSPPYDYNETLASTSEDAGLTWSQPVEIAIPRKYVTGKIHVPIWLDEDTVAMAYAWDVPAEEGRAADNEPDMHTRCGLLFSHDGGRTWTAGGDVDVDIAKCGADEPTVVQLENGDLHMVFRTYDERPWETVSHDNGQSWEQPSPSHCYGHNSPSDLLRLHDGSILRVWDNSPTSRFPLVASISSDECRSWSPPRVIEEPDFDDRGEPLYRSACYPSAIQAADGTIILSWWQTTKTESNIGMARFDRQWVEQAGMLPTIVAFGASGTRGVREGVEEYHTYRERLRYRLKAAGIEARVINAGVGGSNTRDALQRLDSDVLAHDPDIVTIMFGLNDAAMVDGGPDGPIARTEPRVPLDEYRANLAEIVRRIKAAGAKPILCTVTPISRDYVYSHMGAYGEVDDMNYRNRDYCQAAREVASEAGIRLVDVFAAWLARDDWRELLGDGMHANPTGHALTADLLFDTVRTALPTA